MLFSQEWVEDEADLVDFFDGVQFRVGMDFVEFGDFFEGFGGSVVFEAVAGQCVVFFAELLARNAECEFGNAALFVEGGVG